MEGSSGNQAQTLKPTQIRAGVSPQYFQRLAEILRYGDLLWMLSYRDIRVRYAQTFLGITWAALNPIISVLLLYFVFGVVAKVDTQSTPPLLFTMAGLYGWNYFARVVSDGGGSIVSHQSLVRKVYFPRLIIPLSKAFGAAVDLVIVLMLLLIMMMAYRMPFTLQVLWIIPLTALIMLAGIAFGIWVSALTIRYRDFNHILPLILRIGIFISPVAYSAGSVPEGYRWAYNLNPLTGIIEGIRWSLFNTPFDVNLVWVSLLVIGITLFTGIWYFIHMEQYIADII